MPEEQLVELVNSETELFRSIIDEMLITDSISQLFFLRRWMIKYINRILVFKLKHWKEIIHNQHLCEVKIAKYLFNEVDPETLIFRVNIKEMSITDDLPKLRSIKRYLNSRLKRIFIFNLERIRQQKKAVQKKS